MRGKATPHAFAREPNGSRSRSPTGLVRVDASVSRESDRSLGSVSESLDLVNESLHATIRRIDAFLAGQARTTASAPKDRSFRALFDSGILGITIVLRDGTMTDANDAFARMVGYTRDEVRAVRWPALAVTHERSAGDALHEGELLRKDGTSLAVLVGAARTVDDSVLAYVIDNSNGKRAEASLTAELRSIAAHLETVREEQSAKLSRELHDILGQALTGLRLDAAWVARRLGDDHPAVVERLGEMQTRIDELIGTVREIARELHPRILDDLGLGAALETLAAEWSKRSGVAIEVIVPERLEIDRERSTALFRSVQELLTNVARHAHATHVTLRIYLSANDRVLALELEDDGRGMALETVSSSLGFLGIRERLITFAGALDITSAPGRGTRVQIRLPLGDVACAS